MDALSGKGHFITKMERPTLPCQKNRPFRKIDISILGPPQPLRPWALSAGLLCAAAFTSFQLALLPTPCPKIFRNAKVRRPLEKPLERPEKRELFISILGPPQQLRPWALSACLLCAAAFLRL